MMVLVFLLGAATRAAAASASAASAAPELFEWERGFGLRVPGQPAADMFLWIYEWNMFGAMEAGQHTKGTYQLERTLNAARTEAVAESPALRFTLRTVADGAELRVRVTNRTAHAWPELAGIIPCWNPGQVPGSNPSSPLPLNRNFADARRTRTFFLARDGLTPLVSRSIRFNAALRPAVDRAGAANGGWFPFTAKWPTSEVDSVAGLLVRESEDGEWVTGIGWADWLSVQGHNPWSCLHACVRLGALRPGESVEVRGRLYLFRGGKDDLLARFTRDFPARVAR